MDGRIFYVDNVTQSTHWELPKELLSEHTVVHSQFVVLENGYRFRNPKLTDMSVDDVFAMLSEMVTLRRTRLLDLFREVDRDTSGELEPAEVKELLHRAGLKADLDDGLFQRFYNVLDENGDGSVTYVEFSRIIQKKKKDDDGRRARIMAGGGAGLRREISDEHRSALATNAELHRKVNRSSTASKLADLRLQALIHDHADERWRQEDAQQTSRRRQERKLEAKKAERQRTGLTARGQPSSRPQSPSAEHTEQPSPHGKQRLIPRISVGQVQSGVQDAFRVETARLRNLEVATLQAKTDATNKLNVKREARLVNRNRVVRGGKGIPLDDDLPPPEFEDPPDFDDDAGVQTSPLPGLPPPPPEDYDIADLDEITFVSDSSDGDDDEGDI